METTRLEWGIHIYISICVNIILPKIAGPAL